MKLIKFRVENYKTIQDSDWVECEDVTAFIGKNEAGKTSLLRALSKLKSTDKSDYDAIKEFPHGRYTDEFKKQDWRVVTAVFAIDDVERGDLAQIHEAFAVVREITVAKTFSGEHTVTFSPMPSAVTCTLKEWIAVLKDAIKAVEKTLPKAVAGATPEEKEQVKSVWTAAQQKIAAQVTLWMEEAEKEKEPPQLALMRKRRQFLLDNTQDDWSRTPIDPIITRVEAMIEKLEAAEKLERGDDWVLENMPSFLFFANYQMLQSAIYLPEFVSRSSGRGRNSPETRVQQALFKHVGVDAGDLSNLSQGRSNGEEDPAIRKRIDQLTIMANSASQSMTQKFGAWWQQRTHQFHYEFNGEYFRIWVSDNLNPSKVELEERSEGFRYFFSFYLLFLVEAAESHKNCILLLDEPGLHLHGTAQAKLLAFFDKLAAEGNQVLYSTHSPFLVDGDHLERARTVYESEGGTVVSDDVWPTDNDSLFPLQAALGYSICQSLFIAKQQILIEGPTDYMLLLGLNAALPESQRLSREIIMLPVGGASNFAPFAALLASHGVKFIAIPDSDSAGNTARAKLQKLQQMVGPEKSGIVTFNSLLGEASVEELEDIIPEPFYLAAVKTAYPAANLNFTAAELTAIPSVVDRCKERIKQMPDGKFDKLLPVREIVRQLHAQSDAVPKELLESGAKLFAALNALF